jgi:hypothetical protein
VHSYPINPLKLYKYKQFLKKLSIFAENKEEMAGCGAVERLLRFVPVRNDLLLGLVLRTLHNLSFDRYASYNFLVC